MLPRAIWEYRSSADRESESQKSRLSVSLRGVVAHISTMPKPSATRYRTTNWSACNASLRRCGSLSFWFDLDMAW